MKSELVFTHSAFLIAVCLLLGLGYAWLFYSPKDHLNRKQRLILGGIRAFFVALIAFLLLKPLLRNIAVESLRPRVVIGIDNSASLQSWAKQNWANEKEKVAATLEKLNLDNYDVEIRDLNGQRIAHLDSVRFDARQTDFNRFFKKIQNENEGLNLKKVLLLSDGVLNTGLSPLSAGYPFEVSTLGLGDSTHYKDLALKGLTANKLAYLGNRFPLQVEFTAHLCKNQQALVLVKSGGEVLDKKTVRIEKDDDFFTVAFELPADKPGKKRFTVEVSPLSGEKNVMNNRREIIIETIDGKQKVLLLAANPHPDVKAIRSILQKNQQFDVQVKVLGIDENAEIAKEPFDLLILHQLPNKNQAKNTLLSSLLAKQKPTLFVLGSQSAVSLFNGMQQVLSITGQNNQLDQVKATTNEAFLRFPKPIGLAEVLKSLSPIFVPFGNYHSLPNSDILLYQQVGNVPTDRPLLILNTNIERKTAVFAAEGLWKWRLEEYENTGGQTVLDEFLLKALELIAVKRSEDKLRVYPTQDVIDVDQHMVLQTEAYDDLFERIEPVDVKLQLSGNGQRKEFEYTATLNNSTFELARLDAGDYSFEAEAEILGKPQKAIGRFIVQDQNIEMENTEADFNFLRTLSQESGGHFYSTGHEEQWAKDLNANPAKSKLVSTEDLREIINLKWLLPLILLLAGLEWGIRKYLGLY
ncbi:VWA domain-containing protein [Marinilongibacter aquaticus]|uniref:VWA domain-containing protein n=1 Tax=Marinilongibacter aquaticus TaxID=2975157 RepID=UPI0021BD94D7|nr:VWA domain-containing protein [Marinilongibacter aquaticus]UBM59450.1 VWA domain-containing protein [Marinilongibacter aquaticus]